MSASFNIILGDLPPNSNVTLFIFGYDEFYKISRPTCVEPVNDILSTKGCFPKA